LSSIGRSFSEWNPESLRKGPSSASAGGATHSGAPADSTGGRSPKKEPQERKKNSQEPAGKDENPEDPELFALSERMAEVEARARKEGFEAGYADGQKKISEDLAPLRESWLAWADGVGSFEEKRLEALAPRLVSILEKAFEKILGERLATPEGLRSLLGRLVREYAAGRTADLLTSFEDFQLVSRFDPGFVSDLASRGVRLSASPDLTGHRIELRFQDRIVSFDPFETVGSFRSALSRGVPAESLAEEEGGDANNRP
jgi:flagellar biosynthesis/type III secretory pathway protein FliH